MKAMKRIGALLCVGALVFGLAACNKPAAGGNAADILAAASQKVSDAKSMEATMTMDMSMSMTAAGQTQDVDMSSTMEMVMFNDPMKLKIDGTVSTMGMEMPLNMYGIEKDGEFTLYSNQTGTWTAQTLEAAALAQYDPQANLNLYLSNGESFKAGAEEDINGVKAIKYTGVIKGDSLEEAMRASGAMANLDQFAAMGMELDFDALLSDMGDMAISVWVDADGFPVRYEMDMAGMMNALYTKLMEQLADQAGGVDIGYEMTVSKMLVTMDCKNYDNATDFEIPEEVMQ